MLEIQRFPFERVFVLAEKRSVTSGCALRKSTGNEVLMVLALRQLTEEEQEEMHWFLKSRTS